MNKKNILTIGEHINITTGYPFDSSHFNSNGEGLPVIRIRDLLESKIETYYDGNFSKEYLIGLDDILIGMDGDFHIVKWKNNVKGLLNQRIMKVSQKEEANININYFYFFLSPFLKDIWERTGATTVKHLSTFDISRATAEFPPLKEQCKIANILSVTESVIEKTQTIIAKYKAIKQGMLNDLFTRGIDIKTGKLRPKQENAPELYKESELGWIPKEWDELVLDECCEILDHLRIPVNGLDRQNLKGDIPYYGANGLQGYINDFIFNEDLILIAEDGGNFEEYDIRPIAYRISGKSWVNNHAHILKAKAEYSQDYIFYSLVHKNIVRFIAGGTRSKLNKSELIKIPIYCPQNPIEQQKIAERLNGIDQKIQSDLAYLNKLQQIKSGLMADLLSGEKLVTVQSEIATQTT